MAKPASLPVSIAFRGRLVVSFSIGDTYGYTRGIGKP